MQQDSELFEQHGRIYVRRAGVSHRTDEYDDHGFDILLGMQREHFWYRGRHRFLHAAVQSFAASADILSAIDLGAGCGGWVDFLVKRSPLRFRELAMADSSLKALELSSAVVGSQIKLFQVDLLDLGWQNRWDIVFLLDVLEHIPDQVAVLRQVKCCLRQNGLLFLTAPALRFFWSYNDELAHHQRRYSVQDLAILADECGLRLIKARYFMFFLSPILYLLRARGPKTKDLSPDESRAILARTHRVPPGPLNAVMRGVFSMETPIGLWLPLPWGASVLGVFQK